MEKDRAFAVRIEPDRGAEKSTAPRNRQETNAKRQPAGQYQSAASHIGRQTTNVTLQNIVQVQFLYINS